MTKPFKASSRKKSSIKEIEKKNQRAIDSINMYTLLNLISKSYIVCSEFISKIHLCSYTHNCNRDILAQFVEVAYVWSYIYVLLMVSLYELNCLYITSKRIELERPCWLGFEAHST